MSRTFRVVRWLLAHLGVPRQDIGILGDLYLTRWFLLGGPTTPGRRVYVHHFHRSDYERALHDHPWTFTSLVLWPGYWEVTDCAMDGRSMYHTVWPTTTWYGPLSILRRPAEWRHAVKLDRRRLRYTPGSEERTCWTLVFVGRKERSWGFWCPTGWKHWTAFDRAQQAGLDGCGEFEEPAA